MFYKNTEREGAVRVALDNTYAMYGTHVSNVL